MNAQIFAIVFTLFFLVAIILTSMNLGSANGITDPTQKDLIKGNNSILLVLSILYGVIMVINLATIFGMKLPSAFGSVLIECPA